MPVRHLWSITRVRLHKNHQSIKSSLSMSSQSRNLKWDNRGVCLNAVELSFYGKALPEAWASFAAKCGIHIDKDGRNNARFTAIPKNQRSGDLYLTGSFHESPKHKGAAVHWHLNWDMAPNTKPPSGILESSKRVGGYPLIIKKMADNWPANSILEVDSSVTYFVNRKKMSFKFVSIPKPRVIGDHTLQRTASMWSVNPPSGAVTKLSIADVSEDVSVIIIKGTCQLELCVDILKNLDEIVWDGVNKFLKKTS